jgi:hypothetical protein
MMRRGWRRRQQAGELQGNETPPALKHGRNSNNAAENFPDFSPLSAHAPQEKQPGWPSSR